MSDKVKLKNVTAQEALVASNLYLIAEAQFDPDARRLCREARRRLPDVRRAENEWQGAGSLDLSLYDRVEAPRQRLWSRSAEQGCRGDPSDPCGEQDIDPLCISEIVSSDGTVDPSLQRAIDVLAVPGLLIGHRVISQGDELALLHEEMASLSFPAIERRRASGAARRVAHELMNSMGFVGLPILRSTSGAPIWPAGVVGSIAHDDRIAVAAVGLRRDLDAVGIDIESAAPLPPDMLELIVTPRERRAIADNPLGLKILFTIKEAVYKAAYPLDHEFLDFHDIEVDLAGRLATTRAGRMLALHWCIFSHVLVVATVQKASMDHLPSS